jgi:asparagine synthase (glutamine-hydrolysing)
MKLAREHSVPVVLQGQGGDELFWGYSWVSDAARQTVRKGGLHNRSALSAVPQYFDFDFPRRLSRPEIGTWIHNLGGLRSGWQQFQRDRKSAAGQLVFYDLISDFRSSLQDSTRLYASSFSERLNGSNVAALFTFAHPWPDIDISLTRLICDTYLRENGIAQGDRLSMASSIELRLPLIDYRLVETVIGLRKRQTDRAQPPKSWFKAAVGDLLPDWVTQRPKRGFNPPVLEWHDRLFTAYGDSLVDGYLTQHGVLSDAGARDLATGPFPPQSITPMSFKALVLEQWCRQMA